MVPTPKFAGFPQESSNVDSNIPSKGGCLSGCQQCCGPFIGMGMLLLGITLLLAGVALCILSSSCWLLLSLVVAGVFLILTSTELLCVGQHAPQKPFSAAKKDTQKRSFSPAKEPLLPEKDSSDDGNYALTREVFHQTFSRSVL